MNKYYISTANPQLSIFTDIVPQVTENVINAYFTFTLLILDEVYYYDVGFITSVFTNLTSVCLGLNFGLNFVNRPK